MDDRPGEPIEGHRTHAKGLAVESDDVAGAYAEPVEGRLAELERIMKLDERLRDVEKGLAKNKPFWREPKLIIAITGVIALVPPFTTAISDHFENQSKLDLSRAAAEHDIRGRYLERALETYRDLPERKLVLRFIATVEDDEVLKHWADQELQVVDHEITDTKTAESELFKSTNDTTTRLIARREQLKDLEKAPQPKKIEGDDAVVKARADVARLETEWLATRHDWLRMRAKLGKDPAPPNVDRGETSSTSPTIQRGASANFDPAVLRAALRAAIGESTATPGALQPPR